MVSLKNENGSEEASGYSVRKPLFFLLEGNKRGRVIFVEYRT
jgi:hypothetical protein